ncbi:MAG: hypothetical protein ABII82_09955 [Verrucomicrobiota bacterium]
MGVQTDPTAPVNVQGEQASDSRRRRRWPIITTGILAALAVVVWALGRDEPPPDDSWMAVELLNPPDDQNAYIQLVSIARQLPKHDWDPDDPDSVSLQDLVKGTKQDEALRAKLRTNAAPLWPLVRAALEQPMSEVPMWRSLSEMDLSAIGALREITWHSMLETQALFQNEQEEAAIEQIELSLKMGETVIQGRGPLIHRLVATAMQGTVVGSLPEITRHSRLSKKSLLTINNLLERHRPRPSDFRDTLKREYTFWLMVEGAEDMRKMLGEVNAIESLLLKSGITHKPNQTRRLWLEHLENFMPLLEEDSLGFAEKSQLLNDKIGHADPWLINRVGHQLLESIAPAVTKTYETTYRQQSLISATQTLLAIRAYQLDHDNALPDSLDVLVPDYLPSVPLDHMDFAPIRYSKEHRAIWSIGTGGDFDATTIDDDEGDPAQIVLRIP